MIIFISLIFTIFILFYFYRRRKLYLFSQYNIPGPKPNFLFGNLIEYRRYSFYEILMKWEKIYGKVFVYFEGPTPNVVISDPDLLQDVMIKQFSNFHGRKPFPMQKDPATDKGTNMFFAYGKRWKRLRTTINPAFADSKMRRMLPLINESIDTYFTKLKESAINTSDGVDIMDFNQRLTMDIICKCVFGIDSDCQRNVNHPFIINLKKFLSHKNFSTLKAALTIIFPEIRTLLIKLFEMFNQGLSQNEEFLKVHSAVLEIIEARKSSSDKRYDLLQLLLNSEVPGVKFLDDDNLCPMNDNSLLSKTEGQTENELSYDDSSEKKSTSKSLTSSEVVGQAVLFVFAGYDTSSTALSYIMHSLALHADIQDKLFKEVNEAFKKFENKFPDSLELYTTIVKLPYLNAVIYETLRLYPFTATIINRSCFKSEGTCLSNGQYISNGTNVIANVYAIHFDKEIWTTNDPNKFDPERFLQKNGDENEFIGPPHPMAWIPFGAGPRNCIGQRLAMMIMKLTLGRFINYFELVCSEKTENPLKLKIGGTIAPVNGVHLLIKERK